MRGWEKYTPRCGENIPRKTQVGKNIHKNRGMRGKDTPKSGQGELDIPKISGWGGGGECPKIQR